MAIDIDSLTEAELIDLNHRIVERLRFMQSMRNHNEMLKFSIGQKVSFDSPDRGRQVGTLVKYNQKSVTVITDGGQKWTVSPHFLSPVKDVASDSPKSGKVVDLKSLK